MQVYLCTPDVQSRRSIQSAGDQQLDPTDTTAWILSDASKCCKRHASFSSMTMAVLQGSLLLERFRGASSKGFFCFLYGAAPSAKRRWMFFDSASLGTDAPRIAALDAGRMGEGGGASAWPSCDSGHNPSPQLGSVSRSGTVRQSIVGVFLMELLASLQHAQKEEIEVSGLLRFIDGTYTDLLCGTPFGPDERMQWRTWHALLSVGDCDRILMSAEEVIHAATRTASSSPACTDGDGCPFHLLFAVRLRFTDPLTGNIDIRNGVFVDVVSWDEAPVPLSTSTDSSDIADSTSMVKASPWAPAVATELQLFRAALLLRCRPVKRRTQATSLTQPQCEWRSFLLRVLPSKAFILGLFSMPAAVAPSHVHGGRPTSVEMRNALLFSNQLQTAAAEARRSTLRRPYRRPSFGTVAASSTGAPRWRSSGEAAMRALLSIERSAMVRDYPTAPAPQLPSRRSNSSRNLHGLPVVPMQRPLSFATNDSTASPFERSPARTPRHSFSDMQLQVLRREEKGYRLVVAGLEAHARELLAKRWSFSTNRFAGIFMPPAQIATPPPIFKSTNSAASSKTLLPVILHRKAPSLNLKQLQQMELSSLSDAAKSNVEGPPSLNRIVPILKTSAANTPRSPSNIDLPYFDPNPTGPKLHRATRACGKPTKRPRRGQQKLSEPKGLELLTFSAAASHPKDLPQHAPQKRSSANRLSSPTLASANGSASRSHTLLETIIATHRRFSASLQSGSDSTKIGVPKRLFQIVRAFRVDAVAQDRVMAAELHERYEIELLELNKRRGFDLLLLPLSGMPTQHFLESKLISAMASRPVPTGHFLLI